ncbi:hypothetical protein [Stetteria hydrogenophila]
MPAVGPGWFLVDASVVAGLGASERAELVEWALSSGEVVLVTSPSLVTVESSVGRVVLSAGVGSLVSPGRPPVEGWLRVARREWVDGCRVAGEPRVRLGWGAEAEGEGVVVALEWRDPAALFVNGVRGRLKSRAGGYPLAALDGPRGIPVLSVDEEGYYVVNAVEGPAGERLSYIAPLASACRREAPASPL